MSDVDDLAEIIRGMLYTCSPTQIASAVLAENYVIPKRARSVAELKKRHG